MVSEGDATAPGPSEKRNLPAGYDDETAQHWKRLRISHLLQADAFEPYQTTPVEYLETDLNGPVTTGWSSWEQHDPFSIVGDASAQYDSWQINDASIGISDTWNHGEHPLSNFGTSSNNIQSDVGFPAVGGVGYDSEIKMELDEVGDYTWPQAIKVSPPTDSPLEPKEPESLSSQQTQRDSTSIDTPGDAKETNTVGATHLDGFDSRYDTCFGVINTSVTTSSALKQGTTAVPVRLKPSEGLSRLYFEESNKYAGIVTVPALSKLLTGYTTKITATLSTPEPQGATKVSRKKANDTSMYRKNSEFPLRIVVYGTMKESSEIGKLVSDAGLYFQHPSVNELDGGVEYFNPHYLARPGAGMPKLDELQISSSNDVDEKSAGILDETSKARLMRVFDSADDEGITSTAMASPRLRSSLKPHQLTALMMMSEKELGVVENPQFPSIWERATLYDGTPTYRHRITARTDSHPYVARGGILADEMGLGKTLSILSLICWSIDSFNNSRAGEDKEQSLSTLIVTPKSTIPSWEEQIRRHIFPDQVKVAVYHGSDRQAVASNFRQNDIVLTTYETMRSEFLVTGPLYIEKWFRVVLDEAHHIGNRNTMKSKAACGIQARRRWCLTGTPIQNSLDNYGALLSFIGVAPFVNKAQFDLWIANPIKQEDKRHSSWNRLQLLVRATSLRRTKKVLDHSLELTTYQERIEHVDLSQSERKLYEFFRLQTAAIASGFWQQRSTNQTPGQQKDMNMLSLLNLLRLICNHQDMLPVTAARAWRAKQSEAIDWRLMESLSRACTICKEDLEETPGHASESAMQKSHSICAMCALKGEGNDADMSDSCLEPSAEATMATDVARPYRFGADNPSSSKIEALIRTLNREQAANQQEMVKTPIKSVIFSYWTKMLDLTQKALHAKGFRCERIDGKMSLQSRSTAIHHFTQDPSCTILLATIGSAGEGIDLTVANFVHLLEPHWNPVVEAQAIARVHRIGQSKPVTATRYVTLDSIEEYVQWIQKDKLRLIARSLNSDGVCQKDVDDERWQKLQHFLAKRAD